MANPVQPQQIIDLEGLDKNIKAVTKTQKEFGTETEKVYAALQKRVTSYKAELQELINTLKGVNPASPTKDDPFKGFEVSAKELKKALELLTSTQQKFTEGNVSSKQALTELKREAAGVAKAYADLTTEEGKNSEKSKVLLARYESLNKSINLLNGELKEAKKATKDVTGSYNELNNSLKRDIASLRQMGGVFDSNTNQISKNNAASDKLVRTIRQKQDALKDLDRQMGSNTRNVGNYNSSLGRASAFLGRFSGGVTGAVSSLGAYGLAIGAVIASIMKLNELVQIGDNLRRSQIGIENVSSSATDASINIDFLRKTAKRLGLEIESLNKGFKLFAGATEGTAFEGSKTREVFEGITVAIAGMQLTTEEGSGAMRAFSQMIAKNTLQSEELKGQLAERLPSAIRLTAEALNITTQELFKQMEQGKVLAIDVLPLLATKFQEVYGAESLRNVDTLTGATSNLNSAWKEFLNAETSPLRKFLVFTYGKFADLLGLLSKMSSVTGNPIVDFQINSRVAKNKEDDTNFLSTLSGQSPKERENQLRISNENLLKLSERYNNTVDEIDKQRIGRQIRIEAQFFKKMTDVNNTENKAELALIKGQADAKAKANEDARKKAAAASLKAAAKKLSEDKASYQVELRTMQAQEKEKVHTLQISRELDQISEAEYIAQLLEMRQGYSKDELSLIEKYEKQNSAMTKELSDDRARQIDGDRKNELESIMNNKKLLNDLYKGMYNDLMDSFRAENSAFLTQAEVLSDGISEKFNTQRGGVEKNRSDSVAKQRKSGRPVNESQMIGFDMQINALDIQEITEKLSMVVSIYDEAYQDIADATTNSLKQIDASGDTLVEKELKKADVIKSADESLARLSGNYATRTSELKKRLADEVTDNVILNNEKQIKSEEELFAERVEKIEAIGKLASELSNSITQVTTARIDNEISRTEKQRDYELSLAGKTAEDKVLIEKEYSNRVSELRVKQARAEKANAIAQIILNTAIGISKVIGQTGVFSLAAWIPVAALGAVQLATVLATEIPEYYKGKKKGDSYEGFAMVGDRGAELVEREGKEQLVSKPTVMAVDRKTEVYTASKTADILSKRRLSHSLLNTVDNDKFVKSTSKVEQLKYAFNSTYNATGLQELQKSVSSGIDSGFNKAKIIINNQDGSQRVHKSGSTITDNTKRRYS
jgi:tape measure domain-containing protein